MLPIEDQNTLKSNDDALSPNTEMTTFYKLATQQFDANNTIIYFQAQRSSLSMQKCGRRSLSSTKAKKQAMKAARKKMSSLKRKNYESSWLIQKGMLSERMDGQTMDPSIKCNSSSSNMVVQRQIELPDIDIKLDTSFSRVINGFGSSSDNISSFAAHRPLHSAPFGKTSNFTIPLPLSKISNSEAQGIHSTMLQPFQSGAFLEGIELEHYSIEIVRMIASVAEFVSEVLPAGVIRRATEGYRARVNVLIHFRLVEGTMVNTFLIRVMFGSTLSVMVFHLYTA
ncbi:hypothetical protein FRX31_021061 [Thalictrum thalictroides]|uniref:Uncharacterized protein n=1 Tax=Thalictrum thalictroides TaxID=46969 RepID=A0A7J6VYD7_THATH|nr:hypothetical protein FRX31_021061 [Thalictrum thalictroides]